MTRRSRVGRRPRRSRAPLVASETDPLDLDRSVSPDCRDPACTRCLRGKNLFLPKNMLDSSSSLPSPSPSQSQSQSPSPLPSLPPPPENVTSTAVTAFRAKFSALPYLTSLSGSYTSLLQSYSSALASLNSSAAGPRSSPLVALGYAQRVLGLHRQIDLHLSLPPPGGGPRNVVILGAGLDPLGESLSSGRV